MDSRRYEAIVSLMDDDLREEVHAELAPCTDEAFVRRYAELHEERFGEYFAPAAGLAW